MAQKTTLKLNSEIQEKVLQFGRLLLNNGVAINKLFVFGSHAKGSNSNRSDIDVCVVSPQFGKDGVDELQFLLKERRKIDSRIEPYPASFGEYVRTETPVMAEIKKYGLEISYLL